MYSKIQNILGPHLYGLSDLCGAGWWQSSIISSYIFVDSWNRKHLNETITCLCSVRRKTKKILVKIKWSNDYGKVLYKILVPNMYITLLVIKWRWLRSSTNVEGRNGWNIEWCLHLPYGSCLFSTGAKELSLCVPASQSLCYKSGLKEFSCKFQKKPKEYSSEIVAPTESVGNTHSPTSCHTVLLCWLFLPAWPFFESVTLS